jgi:uncharacterized membrane protein YphA (DoxX/SURF4 family)
MLSAFPQLFDYSILAITGLRMIFGLWFLTYGYSTLFKKSSQDIKNLSIFEKGISSLTLVVGFFSFIGLFTQIAILVGLFIIFLKWYMDMKSKSAKKGVLVFGFYIVVIGLALLFLGPGVFAIDLPL